MRRINLMPTPRQFVRQWLVQSRNLDDLTSASYRLYGLKQALREVNLDSLHRQADRLSQRMIRSECDEREFLFDSRQFLTQLLNDRPAMETLSSLPKVRDYLNLRDSNWPGNPMGLTMVPYRGSFSEKSSPAPYSDQTIVKRPEQPQSVSLVEIGLNVLGILLFIAGTVVFSPFIILDRVNEWLKRNGI